MFLFIWLISEGGDDDQLSVLVQTEPKLEAPSS